MTFEGSLLKLKRGVYLKRSIEKGETITKEDVYYAMPVQDEQFNASEISNIFNNKATRFIKADEPLMKNNVTNEKSDIIESIVSGVNTLLNEAKIPLSGLEKVQISCHYGLQKFNEFGAVIIDKINREYCKKLIVMSANQQHPAHKHIKKEEAFELLYGDCCLTLNGKKIQLEKGKPVLIARGVEHSFSSENGCIIEEISTTHRVGDSIYEDVQINTLDISDRKVNIKLI